MTRFVRTASAAVSRFSVHLVSSAVIAALLTWLVLEWVSGGEPRRVAVGVVVFFICLLTVLLAIGMYLLNRENYRLKQCPYDLHDINHIYRDALSRLFSVHARPETEQFLLVEREVLNSVCAKIANIFINLTGRKCVVTVKLLTEEAEKAFCFTWARSDREVYREGAPVERYAVGTGENTGFDEALKLRSSSPSYFYAADLQEMGPGYANQRAGWERLYRGTIVVPIHHVVHSDRRREVLGFLSVDTMSANRLNDTYHVQLLAAFADQMYNFLSIMRRRYLLPAVLKEQQSAVEEQKTRNVASS